MAYASASDVESLTRNLLGSSAEFDSSTSPTAIQVEAWLSSGCAAVEGYLGGTVAGTSFAYDLAKQANALFAAWMAERSRINTRVSSDERTRADMFKRDFDAILEILGDMDLADLGIDANTTSSAWAGGISRSDRQTYISDTDRVPPRFYRGQFDDTSQDTTISGS